MAAIVRVCSHDSRLRLSVISRHARLMRVYSPKLDLQKSYGDGRADEKMGSRSLSVPSSS